MSHTALARRYRPKRFSEVATQEHVSDTLKRSVATDRVGHAYLFCGPRGVGKTTLARVLAMALNCPDRTPDGEPCGVCESCLRIWSGNTSLDVVEIDAASNRGVDDARSLRERAMYAPSEEGRFKVYIVDEAHMLTREAWNALLKVLEEPPARVIFVFATTEPQKIQQSAAPILSRCQRFDLRRIGIVDIERQLQSVLAAEGATAKADALRAVARKADGGMRDALSLLDQVMALAGASIDLEAVRRVLGLVEEEQYLRLFDILARRDHGAVFELVERLVAEGYDLVEFYYGLMDALRALLRSALDPETEDPGIPEHLVESFRGAAERFAVGDLVRMLSLAADLETSGSLRRSPNPRVLIEMLLLRFSFLDRTVQLEELLTAVGGGASGDATGHGGSRPPSTGGRGPQGRTTSQSAAPNVHASGPLTARRAGTEHPTGSRAPSGRVAPNEAATDERGMDPVPPRPTPPTDAATGSGSRAASATTETGPATRVVRDSGGQPTRAGPMRGGLSQAWESLLRSGEGVPPGLGPFLRTAELEEGEGGQVMLRLPAGPGLERLQDVRVREHLQTTLSSLHGAPLVLSVGALGGGDGPMTRMTQESVRETRMDDLLAREPLLKEAVEELDLELLD